MSKIKGSAKVWTIVVILIVIIGGVWWWNASQSASTVTSTTSNTPAGNMPVAPVAPAPSDSTQVLTTAPTDNSDAALSQDLSSVGTQLIGLTSDNAAVDAGLTATASK